MPRFGTIAADFRDVDDETRLEMLLEYTRRLPRLAEAYRPLRDRGLNMIHECQAPVFFMVEVRAETVWIHADVPEEAPTARGFVALLVEAFDGGPVAEVRAAPRDALDALGLKSLLGMQRRRGLSAIYRHLQNEAARQSGVEERE